MKCPAKFWPALTLTLVIFASQSTAGESETPDGRALFYSSCATCHVGSSALLGQKPPADLFRDPLVRGDSEEALMAVIRFGTGSQAMPSFAEGLDETESRALVRFIRSQRASK